MGPGQTEEAFGRSAAALGTQMAALHGSRDAATSPDAAPLPDADLDKVMHAELPILGDTVLMGTDMLESLGRHTRLGNNTTINLELAGFHQAQRLFDGLSAGSAESNAPADPAAALRTG